MQGSMANALKLETEYMYTVLYLMNEVGVLTYFLNIYFVATDLTYKV